MLEGRAGRPPATITINSFERNAETVEERRVNCHGAAEPGWNVQGGHRPAKKESRRSGPGGRNTCVSDRANSFFRGFVEHLRV
jgi:hypothetical protein